MLAAVKGIVHGNTVIIKYEDIRDYDGSEVVVTLLNYPKKKLKHLLIGIVLSFLVKEARMLMNI